MIGPTPFAIALSLLVSTSTTIKQQQEGQGQCETLGDWLQRNRPPGDLLASSMISRPTGTNADTLVAVNSECSVDKNGLRGLKWKSTTEGDRYLSRLSNNVIACRVPASCTIVADRILDNEKPIDALVRTLYCHILQRSDSNAMSKFEPYFATLPLANDPSLKHIGSKWERVQLEQLLGHNPTIKRFENWKAQRNQVIERLLSMKDIGKTKIAGKSANRNSDTVKETRRRWKWNRLRKECCNREAKADDECCVAELGPQNRCCTTSVRAAPSCSGWQG